jgi:hypothetical protein
MHSLYIRIKKKKLIEKKRTHLSKVIIINLRRMKKKIKIMDNQYEMDLTNLPTLFVTPTKLMDMDFYLTMC